MKVYCVELENISSRESKDEMMLSVSDNFKAKTNVTVSSQRLMPLLRSYRVIEGRWLN